MHNFLLDKWRNVGHPKRRGNKIVQAWGILPPPGAKHTSARDYLLGRIGSVRSPPSRQALSPLAPFPLQWYTRIPMAALPSIKTPRQRKFDYGMALELALKGLPYQDIADKFGVHVTSVKRALSTYQHLLNDLQPGALEAYRAKRTDLFTIVEREMMCSLLDPSAMAKASLNNRAYAFQQVHTARRLEEGKSTENRSIITAMLDGAHDKLYQRTPQHIDSPPIHNPGNSDDVKENK